MDGGERAIIYDYRAGILNTVYGEGTHFIIPLIQVCHKRVVLNTHTNYECKRFGQMPLQSRCQNTFPMLTSAGRPPCVMVVIGVQIISCLHGSLCDAV